MKDFFSYKGYIFDLDDTLFRETDYLHIAYRQIGHEFGEESHSAEITEFLIEQFRLFGRKNLFNKLIEKFDLPKESLTRMLQILRHPTSTDKIELLPQTKLVLNHLKSLGKTLSLFTNGNKSQQISKINFIKDDLYQIFDLIVYANDFKPKPSPEGLFYILKKTTLTSDTCLMIGDSESDYEAARSAKIDFVNIKELPKIAK